MMSAKEKDCARRSSKEPRRWNASGLNVGAAGNISARLGLQMLITPAGVPYDAMRPKRSPRCRSTANTAPGRVR